VKTSFPLYNIDDTLKLPTVAQILNIYMSTQQRTKHATNLLHKHIRLYTLNVGTHNGLGLDFYTSYVCVSF